MALRTAAGVRMSRDAEAKLMQAQHRAGRAARGVEPDGLARGRKRGVRQRKPQRLADHLRGGRGAQELAASAGRRAGAAAHFGGVLERDLVLGEARADGLHLAASSPDSGSSVTPPGTSTAGIFPDDASAIIIAGSPLSQVATPITPLPRGQRAHQAAQHDRRIVAIGQRIHHARSALRAAVAGIGARSRKRSGAQRFQLARRLGHQQADFPVAGVKAERDGLAVLRAQAAVRAQDQELRIEESIRLPAHAGVLRQAEEIAGGLGEQHLRRERQRTLRARRVCGHVKEIGALRLQHRAE